MLVHAFLTRGRGQVKGWGWHLAGEGQAQCAQVAETPHLVELIGDTIPGTAAPRGHLFLEGLGQRAE